MLPWVLVFCFYMSGTGKSVFCEQIDFNNQPNCSIALNNLDQLIAHRPEFQQRESKISSGPVINGFCVKR
jgi:hypothetical protein